MTEEALPEHVARNRAAWDTYDHFGMHRFEWPDDPAVEFHLNHGDWLRLLRASGFEVTDLIEVRPPEGASTRYRFITLDWARRWPAEEVWKARKRG